MHNLLPLFIQENYRAGLRRGEFSCTAMFVDFSGFSAMTDTLMGFGAHGAEIMAQVMGSIFRPLAETVFTQGGFIGGMAGDAFTAFFPQDPGSLPAVRRALTTAVEIQGTMGAMSQQITPYGRFDIFAKIGLASGIAQWGIITSPTEQRAVYYFKGPAVEGSAEAEHQANPGEVILDGETYTQAEGWIQVERRGAHYRLVGSSGLEPAAKAPLTLPHPDKTILERFYPAAIIEQTQSGEFRDMVNLFINLPTIRDEDQLATLMQTVFELQDLYGGLCAKVDFGDKGSNFLVLWGAPVLHENDLERALNFILDLQSSTSIPVNAGMTYHLAHAGFIGSAFLEEYTGYGRGVNLAARFLTRSARGEVWVSEAVVRRARGSFEFEDLGEMSFKGFAEAVRVFLLGDRRRGGEDFFTGNLIGREAELARLGDFYAPLCAGKFGGALVIFGEAGLGKSRLAHEFYHATHCPNQETLWAVCQVDEILREPLNPLRYWLRGYFGQADGQPEGRNKRNFNRAIDDLIARTQPIDAGLAAELDRLRSFLGALVGLEWTDSLYAHLDPQGRFDNTLISLVSFLQAESLHQPVVLLLEDVHWLDTVSAEFLPLLVRTLAGAERPYPLGILATARPEGSAEVLGPGLAYQEIRLVGMNAGEVEVLTHAILAAPAAPELIQTLLERSQGNPFYVEQILRYLREENRLALSQDRWTLTQGAGQEPLPADVGAILVARLDRLAQDVRQVVLTAAVLGREFEVRILARMLQDEIMLKEDISHAEAASIWTRLDEMHCIFNHILMQDAAYRMLLVAQRQALHALAGDALETLYQGDLAAHASELAYHWEKAGQAQKALPFLELAADSARHKYQNNQAVELFTRALTLSPAGAIGKRIDLLFERELLFFLTGDHSQRLADLEELSRLVDVLASEQGEAEAQTRRAVLSGRWSGYYLDLSEFERAGTFAGQTVEAALATDQPQLAVDVLLNWALALQRLGKPVEAWEKGVRGRELAIAHGYLVGEGKARNMLGLIAWEGNELDPAREMLSQALEIGRQIDDRRLQAMALNNLGNLESANGDYLQTRRFYLEALQLTREIGDRPKEGFCLGNLGWVVGTLGDYPQALSYAEQNQRIAQQIGDRWSQAMSLVNLSAYAGRQGDYPTALAYAGQALQLSTAIGDPSLDAWALTYLGHARFGLERLDDARQAYQRALDIRGALEQPYYAPEPLAGLSRVCLKTGDLPAALGYTAEILAYREVDPSLRLCDEPLRVLLTCWQALQAVDDPRARGLLEYSYHLLQEWAAKIGDAGTRQTFLLNVPYHRQLVEAYDHS